MAPAPHSRAAPQYTAVAVAAEVAQQQQVELPSMAGMEAPGLQPQTLPGVTALFLAVAAAGLDHLAQVVVVVTARAVKPESGLGEGQT